MQLLIFFRNAQDPHFFVMVVKLSQEVKKEKMNSSAQVYSVIRSVISKKDRISKDKEHLWLMVLDSANHIKHLELIGLGTVAAVLTSPVEVFSVALYRRAVRLVIIHNHPAESFFPSRSDLKLTHQLLRVAVLVDIPIVDHLIVGLGGYFSFKDNKLL